MPTSNIRRVRIYISAHHPASSFGVSYFGGHLDGEQNRSYAIVDIVNPAQEEIGITLTPGRTGIATVFALFEYNPMKLYVSAQSSVDTSRGIERTQTTTLKVEIVDTETGMPLIVVPFPENATYVVEIISPTGQRVSAVHDLEEQTRFSFSPGLDEEFGVYEITATLTINDIVFGPFTASVEVLDIRPVTNWPLIIAVAIGSLLVMTALIMALRIRKREVAYQGAVEMASDYRFHGKLSIYAVMLEGGNREIRPFDFALHTVSEKRITLRSILDSVGGKDIYAGAENILFLVGPEESVVMRNNSQATAKIMGRNYEYRSKAQLFYDQKCYIVFEKDENELEIVYRKSKEDESPPVRFNVGASRT